MKLTDIIELLRTNDFNKPIKFYKFVMDNSTRPCDKCLRFADEIFAENDQRMPELPLHPNCDCAFIEVDQAEYLAQQEFEFGNMTPRQWDDQTEEEKYLWCNKFRHHFGDVIDKCAQKYNIPKQLLAGVIANEMLDWQFPDGSGLDGITGGGVGYAQIAVKTAKNHGINGSDSEIKQMLNSYDGSVAIAAKIMKDYLTEFQKSIKNDKSGEGFVKSGLYSVKKTSILESKNIIDMNVPQWLLNSMCAIWNSGIEVIYAKDRMGDDNYPNAFWNGINSCILSEYLPKLVNE